MYNGKQQFLWHIATDLTVQGLAKMLSHNPRGFRIRRLPPHTLLWTRERSLEILNIKVFTPREQERRSQIHDGKIKWWSFRYVWFRKLSKSAERTVIKNAGIILAVVEWSEHDVCVSVWLCFASTRPARLSTSTSRTTRQAYGLFK